jgi:2-succinyl-6-hydroxy-2,4-cyclohexadiene-1-carboxylate synthase
LGVIVLLHGFTHTGASWDPVRAALPGRYRVLAPDIRGHGTRDDVEPVTLDAVVADVAAEAPGSFTLAGYSMGGRLALHLALAHPERITRLVLVSASPGLADAAERDTRRRADEALACEIETMPIEEVAARWAASTTVLAGQPPSVQAAARTDRLRNTPAGLARALRGLGTAALPPLWDRLAELTTPVSLIVGERDAKFRALAEQMTPRFGGPCELIVVPGAGHAVHLEAPEAVAAALAVSSAI